MTMLSNRLETLLQLLVDVKTNAPLRKQISTLLLLTRRFSAILQKALSFQQQLLAGNQAKPEKPKKQIEPSLKLPKNSVQNKLQRPVVTPQPLLLLRQNLGTEHLILSSAEIVQQSRVPSVASRPTAVDPKSSPFLSQLISELSTDSRFSRLSQLSHSDAPLDQPMLDLATPEEELLPETSQLNSDSPDDVDGIQSFAERQLPLLQRNVLRLRLQQLRNIKRLNYFLQIDEHINDFQQFKSKRPKLITLGNIKTKNDEELQLKHLIQLPEMLTIEPAYLERRSHEDDGIRLDLSIPVIPIIDAAAFHDFIQPNENEIAVFVVQHKNKTWAQKLFSFTELLLKYKDGRIQLNQDDQNDLLVWQI